MGGRKEKCEIRKAGARARAHTHTRTQNYK